MMVQWNRLLEMVETVGPSVKYTGLKRLLNKVYNNQKVVLPEKNYQGHDTYAKKVRS